MTTKSTYNFRLNEDLKKTFLHTAKEQGVDGSDILRVFIKYYIKKPTIFSLDLDNWIEALVQRPAIKDQFSSLGNALECKKL